ncbi:DNA/RNA non-specific endonuclease [Peptostreptococcus faecalis]|uniref:DNA/RNA non-specific endonuclease n=1 Tax=Peptostreptococcus faecalis TaxID=2045015 RepID=UPI001FA87A98|nr:DNA/RNA non-specific endonuclease [Peptostreptococcus faecalis]
MNSYKDFIKKLKTLLVIISIIPMITLLSGCSNNSDKQAPSNIEQSKSSDVGSMSDDEIISYREENEGVIEFKGQLYTVVNSNKSTFTKNELKMNKKNDTWDDFSKLDSLNRCGEANAMVGKSIMPTEKRGRIGMVRPSGWKLVKYNSVDGKYLYNRSHLIGYQLTGQNANELNLITGTRYFNAEGMLAFENEIRNYIDNTNNHVRYRVKPVYKGDDLVARGVYMQAKSIEDNGKGLDFNVFVHNVQPGIEINYKNGDSKLNKAIEVEDNYDSISSNDFNSSKSYKNKTDNNDYNDKTDNNDNNNEKLIKGNINSKGEKIYHLPGSANYDRTIPEQTFKTEKEAIEAGFRAAKR